MVDRQDIDALLIGALYGELTPADESRLAAHLESHPADRAALDDLTRARNAVRESGALAVHHEPPPVARQLPPVRRLSEEDVLFTPCDSPSHLERVCHGWSASVRKKKGNDSFFPRPRCRFGVDSAPLRTTSSGRRDADAIHVADLR